MWVRAVEKRVVRAVARGPGVRGMGGGGGGEGEWVGGWDGGCMVGGGGLVVGG